MKKYITIVLSIICLFGFSLIVQADEILHYNFDSSDNLSVVTNTLKPGGTAVVKDGVLELDGTYGLTLGDVNNVYTVSAMVKIVSTGGTDTVFFKDMDNVGNKWTGVLSAVQKPAFWTHGGSYAWTTVASGTENMGEWCHVAYVENNATGSLYVNGELVGTGGVASGAGGLYLGATYWSADAPKGYVDNLTLYSHALSQSEIMAEYERYIDFENAIKLPKEVISDIELVEKIASKTVTWQTSDESVIDSRGKVTRGGEDRTVTLTALIDGNVIDEFEVTVLKMPVIVNEKVLLSYTFGENDGEIIHDISGNGNHAAAYGNLKIEKTGAVFDGVDDYVEMPEGVLYGHDDITIVTTVKPSGAQKHVFLYGFGNTSNTGYMFLNPSRPGTNTLRFAITKTGSAGEKDIASLPGVRNNERVNIAVVISGGYVRVFLDGEEVMNGETGMKVSDLGKTGQNYIAKSLYDADPYFAGVVEEFTIYDYCLNDRELSAYKKDVVYATEDEYEEYITSVSFENGVDVTLDTHGRDDVKIGAVVLDENNTIVEFCVVDPEEKIELVTEGTLCVFAFAEENNIPGNFYVKGKGEGFEYEYTPGEITVTSDSTHENGMLIVAGYDLAGTLTGVSFKEVDMLSEVPVKLSGDFEGAVTFRMLYWDALVSMTPIE